MGRFIITKGMGFVPPELAPVIARALEFVRFDRQYRPDGPLGEWWDEWLADLDELSGGRVWRPAPVEQWITPQDAAERLGVTDRYVRVLCDRRRLQSRKLDGRWQVALTDVLDEVDARRITVDDAA